jgi:hypothetical protein
MPGELRITMLARRGEEHRWQMAALLANTVILQYRPDDLWINYVSLRELCARWEPETDQATREPIDPHVSSAQFGAPTDRESATADFVNERSDSVPGGGSELNQQLKALDEAIDAINIEYDLADDRTKPDYDAWMRGVLPRRLALTVQFIAHVAAVRSPGRLILHNPDHDLSGFSQTWRSIRGVYFWNGKWGTSDPGDWVSPAPPVGAVILKDVIDNTGAGVTELQEIFVSYVLGESTLRGHVPLVPSSAEAHQAAVELYSRFRRVFVATSMMDLGPQAELVGDGLELGPEMRPALWDQLLLQAFPSAATIDPGAFEYLHTMPNLESFRRRLRMDAERIDGLPAAEAAQRLNEIARELRESASAASASLASELTSGHRNLSQTGGVAGLIAGAGFVSFGPLGAVGGGLIAASLTAAIELKKLYPMAAMTGTDLALLTLDGTMSRDR